MKKLFSRFAKLYRRTLRLFRKMTRGREKQNKKMIVEGWARRRIYRPFPAIKLHNQSFCERVNKTDIPANITVPPKPNLSNFVNLSVHFNIIDILNNNIFHLSSTFFAKQKNDLCCFDHSRNYPKFLFPAFDNALSMFAKKKKRQRTGGVLLFLIYTEKILRSFGTPAYVQK